jgi:NAD(P)-dependent dehydrogenase (short-subunit alcohol dehydrogenase family)
MSDLELGKFTTASEVVQKHAAVSFEGKTIIVTGANSGIGYETVAALLETEARIIVCCRNQTKCDATIQRLAADKKVSADRMVAGVVDLGSLKSVQAFAENVIATEQAIHVLINNAGIMQLPNYQESADGFEMQFAVNFLGPYYLTQLLTPLLEASSTEKEPARVINTSSSAHLSSNITSDFLSEVPYTADNYNSWQGYARSKMLQVVHAQWIAKHNTEDSDKKSKIVAVALMPGVIATGLGRNAACCSITWWLYCCPCICRCAGAYKNAEEGAAPQVRCAVDPMFNDLMHNGSYIHDNHERNTPHVPRQEDFAERLIVKVDQLIAEALAK